MRLRRFARNDARFRRRIAATAALVLGVSLSSRGGWAQALPPAPVDQGANPVCIRLESQLAMIDRGISDPGGGDQVRRYEEAAGKQQADLDRVVQQSRRMGCEGSGFFLFGRGQSPQCVDLNSQIQRMRAALDSTIAQLQRLQSGSVDRGEQRQAVLAALGANNCGPQYRAAPPRPRGFLEMLFGGPAASAPDYGSYPGPDIPQSSTYRTLCVRTCDGYYFPISFATVPAKFQDDERMCQRTCPAAEVALYTHRNPGEGMAQAVSLAGRPYTQLPTAFRYRQELNPACACKKPGQTWAEALGATGDATLERGDIVVTEEQAKALAQPKPDPKPPIKPDGGKRQAPPRGTSAADPRSLGSPYYPPR
jgi:Protein of unknown function (DUF2865)